MGDRKAGADNFHADREQVDEIEQYARRLGLPVELLPPELDTSGGSPIDERPSLKAAIEGVERGKYGGIVVAYLSRLTRSRSGLAIWERVEAAGGRVHCAREGVDTSTANGRWIRDLYLSNAVREREEKAEMFEHRARVATEAGVWQRRQTPRGYDRDPETRALVPNADAESVREAFRAKAAQRPIVEISRDLGMTPNGVRGLLRNRVYLGELRVRQYVKTGAHEPLIDEELFHLAQQARSVRPARGADRQPALLAGLVRCSGCGHAMTRGASGNRGRRLEQYVCPKYHSAGTCAAPASITLTLLNEHVQRIALHELAKLRTTATARTGRLENARTAVRAAEAELAAYVEATSAAAIGAELFSAGLRQRQAALDEARAALARELERESTEVDGDPIAAWERFDVSQRNRLLRRLIECVIVERSGGRGRIRPVEDRVRVVALGTGLAPERTRGGVAMPLVPLPLPDLDDEGVLGMDLAE